MKANVKKILLFLSLAVVLIGITGCGPNTVTTVNLNEDMSGERVMQMYMSSTDQEEWILTDLETMDTVVSENCPKELEYSMVEAEDGSGYNFIFTLKFDSIEDYEEKMSTLADRDVTVTVQIADTVFSSGIYMEEDCYSSELLGWLPDLLVENEIIEESNSSNVLNNSTTTLNYQEQEYSSWLSGRVDIEQLDSIALSGVNIFSTLDGEEISRTIEVDIPLSSYEKKGAEIEEYLEAHVPAGASGEMVDGEYGNKLFTITIPQCSLTDMEEAMKTFSDSDEVEISMESTDTSAKYGIASCLHEKLDLASYISNNPDSVYSNYYVSDNIVVDEVQRICGDEETSYYVYTGYEYEDYYDVSSAYAVKYDLNTKIVRLYRPHSMTVVTDVAKDGNITHSFEMGFAEDILAQDKDFILESAKEDVPENMTVSWGEGEKADLIIFKISGTASQLQSSLEDYLYTYDISFDMDDSFIKPKQSYEFNCLISISTFEDIYTIESPVYEFHLPGDVTDASISKNYSGYGTEDTLAGNVYKVSTKSDVCQVNIEGSVLNVMGIIILAVIAVIVVVLIIFVVMILVKKNKKKKATMGMIGIPMQPGMPGFDNGIPMQPGMPGFDNGMPMQPGAPGFDNGMPMQPGFDNGMPMQPGMPGFDNGMPMQPEMSGFDNGMPSQPVVPDFEPGTLMQPEVLANTESVSTLEPVSNEDNLTSNEKVVEETAAEEITTEENVSANDVNESDEPSTTDKNEIPQEAKQFCPQCGNEIVANAAFCENCGMSIND